MNDLVRRNDPFDIFSRFGDFFEREPFLSPAARTEWMPPVDIRETDEGYVFHMDVPGLKPEDLDVELHEGVLSIRGTRSEETKKEDKGYVRMERRQGSFSRQFSSNVNVKRCLRLKAEVKDGVLTIEVPKGAPEVARKVPIS